MWLIFPGLKIMHSVQIASLLRLRSPHIASTTGAGRGQFAQIQNQNASKCSALFCAIVHLWFAYPSSNIYAPSAHSLWFFRLDILRLELGAPAPLERIIPGWRSHSLALLMLFSCDHHPNNCLLCILQDLTSGSSRYIKKKKYDGCISFKCLVFLRF